VSVDDAAIAERIRQDFRRYGQIWCPHTAAAAEGYAQLPEAARAGRRWVLVATAHPAKFREIIEPLIDRRVALPENLARLYERPAKFTRIAADFAALKAALYHAHAA
jgi:threonine synthase